MSESTFYLNQSNIVASTHGAATLRSHQKKDTPDGKLEETKPVLGQL